jgi:hypothetical protein
MNEKEMEKIKEARKEYDELVDRTVQKTPEQKAKYETDSI